MTIGYPMTIILKIFKNIAAYNHGKWLNSQEFEERKKRQREKKNKQSI